MTKTNLGRFFEDYSMGMVLEHAVPRTVGEGERALYHALYPVRHALYSSDEFARACGFKKSPLDDLIAFHIIFGKTVPDVSLNAIANLGDAMGRWHRPVYAGDTLSSTSKVMSKSKILMVNLVLCMCIQRERTKTTKRLWTMFAGSWCASEI